MGADIPPRVKILPTSMTDKMLRSEKCHDAVVRDLFRYDIIVLPFMTETPTQGRRIIMIVLSCESLRADLYCIDKDEFDSKLL